jgi:indole-3-glycerol phosphate synthase
MSILKDIETYKRREIEAARKVLPIAALEERARSAPPVRGFRARLEESRAQGRPALIAEIKKASPSKGVIRADFDPAGLARAYERGGAACLSVLTDAPSFQGSPEYLRQARSATHLPILRKDFLFDPYQVVEARTWGADCILVILACIEDAGAHDLLSVAGDHAMDALIEVHDENELDRALGLDARLIGINNRDLNTFATDLSVTLKLAPRVPRDRLVIAESGISTLEDLERLAEVGVTAFLVGESLMRQNDVEAATRTLLGRA